MRTSHAAAALAWLATACVQPPLPGAARPAAEAGVVLATNSVTPSAGETRFSAIRQLTAGGQNAEAYFSRDGRWLTFQSAQLEYPCDQQYVMRLDGSGLRRVSDGRGKTTCGWFFPDGKRLFFGSTTAHQDRCPPRPDPSAGYVWPLDPYDIYAVDRDGTELKRLTHFDVYTAEGILSPDGKRIVFTSLESGDLEIYTMNVDGTDVRRLTHTPGYDGGPWWSPDGKKIVYRANHPADSSGLAQYRSLLARNLVRPSRVELFIMNADGSDQRQITRLGGANFGPSWTPDGRRIIFSSNYRDPRSGNFDLYMIDERGGGLEQVTTDPGFDGFPMFSPDGRRLIWASSRGASRSGETNLFLADWK
jgi:TolB protein